MQTVSAKRTLWMFALAILWVGMIAAISFIEAPLKFQAPGITIPLGLGIGRLVFGALNLVEGILLVALAGAALLPWAARIRTQTAWLFTAIAAVYLVKVAVIRPPLNARTDLVLAGAEPGQSVWHYFYIAADMSLMVLLVLFALAAAKHLLASRNSDIRHKL